MCVCVCVFVKTLQTLHLKCMYFIIDKLYINEVHFFKGRNNPLLHKDTNSILVLLGIYHVKLRRY